jgi:ribulose-phosphate 3-epimerase
LRAAYVRHPASGFSKDVVMPRLQLAPSILTADFTRLGEELASVADYVDWYHLDVMDGHYVPNLTFGPSIVEAVHRAVDQPLHVHLMIEDPGAYAEGFVRAGAARVSFHPEATPDAAEVIATIRRAGAGAGIAVHPDVDVSVLEGHLDDIEVALMMTVRPGFGGQEFLDQALPKVALVEKMVGESGASVDIEVDGGINLSTVDRAVEAGGRILVAGSAIFDGVDAPAAARRLRDRLDALNVERDA